MELVLSWGHGGFLLFFSCLESCYNSQLEQAALVLTSAVQHCNCRFGFLCLFLLHLFCFLFVYMLTPQPSTAVPPKYASRLFCFCEQTDVSCWPLSVQEGWMLHSRPVSGHCCCIFFFPFESCISFCLPEILPEKPIIYE